MFSDTGMNIPESVETLKAQQARLLAGRRHVQMFPVGTVELELPGGFQRHQNDRGIFHFRASEIGAEEIDRLSREGRENEFLELGPFNKTDIAERLAKGESLFAIVEFDPRGVEVRGAAGSTSTLKEQHEFFERTKGEGGTVLIVNLSHLMARRMAA